MIRTIRSPNLLPGEQSYAVLLRGQKPLRFAKGGLATYANAVRAAGRYGDDMLIHINRGEFEQLRRAWGEPSIHPQTGLPEYFDWVSLIKSVLTNAAAGAATAAVTGGDAKKGAVIGGVTGGLGGLGSQNQLGSYSDAASNLDLYKNIFGGGSPGIAGTSGGMSTTPGDDPSSGLPGAVSSSASSVPSTPKGGALSSLSSLASNPAVKMAVMAAVLSANRHPPQQQGGGQAPITDPNFSMHLPQLQFNRSFNPANPASYYTYGQGPEHTFFNGNSVNNVSPVVPGAARGGGSSDWSPRPAAVSGPGTGRSDDIPAKLSDGEYVMDAETVGLLGDGSTKAGAARLDEMRKNLRQHKGKALAKGQFSPAAKPPEQYIKGAKVSNAKPQVAPPQAKAKPVKWTGEKE